MTHESGLQLMTTAIMAFEAGELSDVETVKFFSALRKSGLLSHLQGMYWRDFRDLVAGGWLDANGNILLLPDEEEFDENDDLEIKENDVDDCILEGNYVSKT